MYLYKCAEGILIKLRKQNSSVKNLVYAEGKKIKNIKQLYALVCETLKYKDVVQDIINQSKIFKNSKISDELSCLLVYDFLFGKGIQCGGRFKAMIQSRKILLQSTLTKVKVQRKVMDNKDLVSQNCKNVVEISKYLRINTLLAKPEAVKKELCALGYSENDSNSSKSFKVDGDIPNLLAFPTNSDFHKNKLYVDGHLIIQDKASCMPAFVLNPAPESIVIDACAAPGNKTSHLAAIMKNSGKIFAFDISSRRLKTMDKLLKKAGVTNCETINSDFLKIPHADEKFQNVDCILVDPSCSGSGIVSRMSHLTDTEVFSAERLASLQMFQKKILNHALSFPKVSKVVYSTCSINEMENELVVLECLKSNPHFTLVNIMPKWPSRGIPPSSSESVKCIRCDPKYHNTNGFFVALFQRK